MTGEHKQWAPAEKPAAGQASGSAATAAVQHDQPVLQIHRIYLKDMSLEQPNSPAIFLKEGTPAIELEIMVDVHELEAACFESQLTVTVTAKLEEQVALVIEALQAGIFEAHVPEGQLDQVKRVTCPGILFPYLRANVADAITRAGFPALHLADINFGALYDQHLAQRAAVSAPAY